MKRYPEEVHQFIMQNVQGRTTQELADLVNEKYGPIFTEAKMKSYKANHRLKSGTPCGLPAGRPTEQYPQEIQDFIEKNHPSIGPKAMSELLNKTFGTSYTKTQIKSYYRNHSIDSGLKGYFGKGHVPTNKGKKYPGKINSGCFVKGRYPHNYDPIGTEKVKCDGYIWVKTGDPNIWKQKHRLLWEEVNGKIPEGYKLIFADGNRMNITLGNLVLVTNSQMLILNRKNLIYPYAELTKVGVSIAKLHNAVYKRLRRKS